MAQGQNRSGSFRLFRLFGIDVSLHWSWLLVALFVFQDRQYSYEQRYWAALEYLSLFVIVLMHEFGHALACRSVGGKAEHIMLWPLGGVAYVRPPQRPGALLWSIFAGPLVNIILIPVTVGLMMGARMAGWDLKHSDPGRFAMAIMVINLGLLVFNLLPIYPLDGGQILRALLWFLIGQARSLMVAATIGLVGAAGVMILALYIGDYWLVILAVFGAMQSWAGFRGAQVLHKVLSAPRYSGLRCPSCGAAPPAGPFWRCRCGQPVDGFANTAGCPRCGQANDASACPYCGTVSPVYAWQGWPPPLGFPVVQPAGSAEPYVPPNWPPGRDGKM